MLLLQALKPAADGVSPSGLQTQAG
jgi:hypothetical protein